MNNNEKAIVELFEVCSRAINQKIDRNQRTAAKERLQQEIKIIRKQGLACLFLDLKKFIESYGIQAWEIDGRDYWMHSSLIAFLLGLSETDPLLLQIPAVFLDKDVKKNVGMQRSIIEFGIPFHYAEILDRDSNIHRFGFMPSAGSSGHNPDAPIRVRYTCGMKQNIELSKNHEILYQLAEITGVSPDGIGTDEQTIFIEMKNMIRKDAEDYLRTGEEGHPIEEYCDTKPLDEFQPADIYQFGKLIRLVYQKPLYIANMPVLEAGRGLKSLVISREDIYDVCKEYGMDSSECYMLACDTFRGLWQWGGGRKETIQKRESYEGKMRSSGMPQYYITAIEGAFNGLSRGRNTEIALTKYRLAWYKVHYEVAYNDVVKTTGK